MQVFVLDVEHGGCSAVLSSSRELMLIGCGHNASSGWRPSHWVRSNSLEVANLTIDNLDEDHVSDLPELNRTCTIRSFSTNWHLSADWVRKSKADQGMGPGIRTAVGMMEHYTGPSYQPHFEGMNVQRFCHPPSLFQDLNSLSLVTFISLGGVRMVFPGDLTRQAWRAFLQDTVFCSSLRQTNIFVASHHGREDGYCPEVFDFCKPNIVIVSDMPIQYGTQEVDYAPHATGLRWSNGSTRYVLTTRKDGTITIQERGGSYHITTSR